MKNKDPLIIAVILRNTLEKKEGDHSLQVTMIDDYWNIYVGVLVDGCVKNWSVNSYDNQKVLTHFMGKVANG